MIVTALSADWYGRRALLLRLADADPGWGCVRLALEPHIGRVLMAPKYGAASGFYREGTAACSYLNAQFAADQKRRTTELPK